LLNNIYKKKEKLVVKKVKDEYIIVPIVGNLVSMDAVYTLNEVGAFIWEQIDGKKSLIEIIEKITFEFHVDAETAKTDLIEFIKQAENKIINIIK
jgi:hypothetical protein